MIITGKKFSKPKLSRIINGDDELKEAPTEAPKTRLDLLLVDKYKSYNRSSLQKFVEAGFVKVDGKVVTKVNTKFPDDAKLELNVPETLKNSDLIPETIYEDENVIVINKPAGLLSMKKGEYCPEKTLEDYGLLVHRLDRDTSGVVILAKNPDAQTFLRKQFQDRKAHKTYYAVVEGHPKLDEANIDLPIARDLKRPTTFRVDPNGRPSQTHYKVIEKSATRALVELHPTTGRTHQLRVHLAYLGCPIVGDPVYGDVKKVVSRGLPELASEDEGARPVKTGPNDPSPENNFLMPPRLFLHAYSLEITLPGGERHTFTTDLPKEFRNVL